MNLYRETEDSMTFREKLMYIILIVLFAAGLSLALFTQTTEEAKAEEAAASVMQEIDATTIPGVDN